MIDLRQASTILKSVLGLKYEPVAVNFSRKRSNSRVSKRPVSGDTARC